MLPPTMGVEMRHLRAFVAVAEDLNFTRAAERLFIAQQALSAQIRQLESRLGTRLFERDTRRVSLTSDGETFLEHARPVIDAFDAAVAAIRTPASASTLRLGFVVSIEHTTFAETVSVFEQRYPDTKVLIRFGDTTDPSGGLRSGQVDVAFVYGPFDRTGLETRYLFTEPLGVLMSSRHSLAHKDPLGFDDIEEEPTFDFPSADREWRAYWMATDLRSRPPHIVAQFTTLDGLVGALKAGLGIHTGTKGLADIVGEDIVWRQIEGLPPLDHHVCWRSGDRRREVQDFVEVAVATVPGVATPV